MGERWRGFFQIWGCWSLGLEFRGDDRSEDDILGIVRAQLLFGVPNLSPSPLAPRSQ